MFLVLVCLVGAVRSWTFPGTPRPAQVGSEEAGATPKPGIRAGGSIEAGGRISAPGDIEAGSSHSAAGDRDLFEDLREASPFVREMVELASTTSPVAAVQASLQRLGHELANLLDSEETAGLNVPEMADLALAHRRLNERTRDGIDGVAVMHTMALLDEGGRRLTQAEARSYIGLIEGLMLALRGFQRHRE
jgi:hypothetical protein